MNAQAQRFVFPYVFYAYGSLLCHNEVISVTVTLLFKSRAAVQVRRKRAYK